MSSYYFVSYSYPGGFGNCEITVKYDIASFDDLQVVKELIEENDNSVKNVIIINFVKLRKFGDKRNG